MSANSFNLKESNVQSPAEAIRLGGTITGEHGIGIAKKSFLPKFAGDAQMRVMRELRKALDPAWVPPIVAQAPKG